MFENIRSFVSRKRPARDALVVLDLSQKENHFVPPQKKERPVQKVCLKCLAGEGGHITHILSEVPKVS
ncbi:unnamed protein product [Auanema sp. JU1783]|nr:unnamed protein product [Auanema sp. JU1783]